MPECTPGREPTAKFADVAVPELIEILKKMRAVPNRLVIKLVGGAHMTPAGAPGIGRAEMVTRAAVDLLEETDDAPYFLWAHYKDPHYIYRPPKTYLSEAEDQALEFYRHTSKWKPAQATVFFNLNGQSERWKPAVSLLYDAEVRFVDDMIDRLLTAVRSRATRSGWREARSFRSSGSAARSKTCVAQFPFVSLRYLKNSSPERTATQM